LEQVMPDFDVTLYFCNPNLNSEAEFVKRLAAQETVAAHFGVPLMVAPYDSEAYAARISGLEAEPEGGARCECCFALRLEDTVKLAMARGFDRFGTTLSVSPHKDADLLNEIGARLERQYGIPYLAADFKKKEGYHRSAAIARALLLYRQNYCGCLYSLR